jgi:protein-ribulosamine 3-kinase
VNVVWDEIDQRISQATNHVFQGRRRSSLSGGSISQAFRVEGGGAQFFVKLHASSNLTMFEAEAAGLQALAETQLLMVPEPVCWGVSGEYCYLVMSYLDVAPRARSLPAEAVFGERLAQMHQQQKNSRFGWYRDNTIGSTLQRNSWHSCWLDFYRDQRLAFQLDLVARQGYASSKFMQKGERLLSNLAPFFSDYQPDPSLLHGDLWSGNVAMDVAEQPVVFDPAVYYGDREADLAMSELFSGFSGDFYAAYRQVWPLDVGYPVRKILYNLYHVLNHLNLFGRGYLAQAENMIDRLLSEIS